MYLTPYYNSHNTTNLWGTSDPWSTDSEDSEYMLIFNGLIAAMEEHRYEDAIGDLDCVIDRVLPLVNDAVYGMALLAKVTCYEGMHRYDLAINTLEKIMNKLENHQNTIDYLELDKEALLKDCLNQHKALLFLNLGKEIEAIEILRSIPPKEIEDQIAYRLIEKKLNIELFDPKLADKPQFVFGLGVPTWLRPALRGHLEEALQELENARNNDWLHSSQDYHHEHALIHALNGNFEYSEHLNGAMGDPTYLPGIPNHLIFQWLKK